MAEGWVDHALGALSAAGYRRGGARHAVVEELGRRGCAVTARDVDDALREGGRAVGLASIYRTLEQLAELGLVQRCDLGETVARYEVSHPDGAHHHHMVCDRCGRVAAFEDPELEGAIERLARRTTSFAVREHDVVLRGRCGGCAA